MKQKRLSKEELAALYSDVAWQASFLRLSNIVAFLRECILRPDYKIPDDMNNVIALTPFGQGIQQALVTKHQVPAKEARLICLLTLAHVEPIVDVEKINLDALEASLHQQLLSEDLRFPFIFGREMYDRAAELFEDERSSLSFEDTTRLLEGLPIGVFQVGDLIVGPYGLIRASDQRWLYPTTRVPLHHCSELTCDRVHACWLHSDSSAPVNEHLPKITKLLKAEAEEPSAWSEFLADLVNVHQKVFDDRSMATLPYLLGDALSDSELRRLVATLLDETKGQLRGAVAPLGISGDSESAVEGLGRAHLMQICLLAPDAVIGSALDGLVADGSIAVPLGEVRTPVVNAGRTSGRFGLSPELGHFGCRFQATSVQIGPLRLRRLVEQLYVFDHENDIAELEWQLRGVDAPTLSARLDEYVRTSTPEQVVRRLVLARRTNMITACTALGIDEHRVTADEDLVSALLWKLGFQLALTPDVNGRFWQVHDKMKQVTQTAGVSALVDQEAVRALASNYFVLLEEVLDDALAFAVWALTTDHLATDRPFTYRGDEDRSQSFERLDEAESARDSGPEILRFKDKSTLYELCRGFGSLAAMLKSFQGDPLAHSRPDASTPMFAQHTDLKKFPFKHDAAFLDLLPSSQEAIVGVLEETSRGLVAADVSGVRNDQLHFRRSTADLGRLSACLAAVESAVRGLEQSGFTRLAFHPVSEQGDQWGRRIFVFSDPRDREIAIARPTSYDWIGLPEMRTPQYLMTTAVFAEPTEILRFANSLKSEYTRMWAHFPKRRTAGPHVAGLQAHGSISLPVSVGTGNEG